MKKILILIVFMLLSVSVYAESNFFSNTENVMEKYPKMIEGRIFTNDLYRSILVENEEGKQAKIIVYMPNPLIFSPEAISVIGYIVYKNKEGNIGPMKSIGINLGLPYGKISDEFYTVNPPDISDKEITMNTFATFMNLFFQLSQTHKKLEIIKKKIEIENKNEQTEFM